MAGLKLRTQLTDTNSAGIILKGSALTYAEADSNFLYLLTNMSGSTLSLTGTTNVVGNTGITGNLTLSGNLTLGGQLTSTLGFSGNLAGTATTASYVKLVAGPGIVINAANPLTISSSIVTVNGIFPTNGNIPVSITQTLTGTSASFQAYVTSGATPDGLTWVIANNTPDSTKNGNTYIWSSGSAAWFQIAAVGQATNDARYLMLTPQQPLSGTLNMGTFGITNAGTYQGTASWASNVITASYATTASYITSSFFTGTNAALSSSYALTASYALNGGGGSGTVSGSDKRVAVFSGSAYVTGSSIMTDNGTVVTITGSLNNGVANTTPGPWSHAEGSGSSAIGTGSHAEGQATIAYGDYSYAAGFSTLASGSYSYAGGNTTTTLGNYSHVEGYGTIASSSYQFVVGRWNQQGNTTSIFTIGGGADNATRKDVVSVTTSSVTITGSLNIASGSITLSSGSIIITGSVTISGSLSVNEIIGTPNLLNSVLYYGSASGDPGNNPLRIIQRTNFSTDPGLIIGAFNTVNTASFGVVLGSFNENYSINSSFTSIIGQNNYVTSSTIANISILGYNNRIPSASQGGHILIGNQNISNTYTNTQNYSILIGYNNNTNGYYGNGIIGSGLKYYGNNQLLFGANSSNVDFGIKEVWFGRGVMNESNAIDSQYGSGSSVSINVSRAYSGSLQNNTPGGNLTLNGGQGTGTGSAGDIIFATPTTGSTGTTHHTQTSRVWIKGHTGAVGINTSNPDVYSTFSGSVGLQVKDKLTVFNGGGTGSAGVIFTNSGGRTFMTMDSSDFAAYTDNQSKIGTKWLQVSNGFYSDPPLLRLSGNSSTVPVWGFNYSGSPDYRGVVNVRGNSSYNYATAVYTRTNTLSQYVAENGDGYFSGSVTIGLSGSAISSTTKLLVQGSGSSAPLLTVQGSQGQLFSVTDSLSGSLFSVNDVSGLPILDVNSDSTVKIGNYYAPALFTTVKKTANTGVTILYSLLTGSYDGVWVDYTIRSGSNARVGQVMAMWSASIVNYAEVSASQFGSTTVQFKFGANITGSNMIITGSATTDGWTVKTIIRSI